jgi:hypothetical protein
MHETTAVQTPSACRYCGKPEHGSAGCETAADWPASSADYWQQRGYLGEPEEWREACRLYRARCSAHDCEAMARLHSHIEDGLLVVVRPARVMPNEPAQARRREAATSPAAPCSAQRAGGGE